MRQPVVQLKDVDAIERELDVRLRELRNLDGTSNTMARTSIEYRIGRLRDRKRQIENG